MDLSELIKAISARDVAGVAFLFLTVVQITPIKINPWTWIAKTIGRAITSDLMQEVKCMRRDLVGVHKELDELKEREAIKNADDARNRILKFADELRQHIRHSKEYFDQIISDIDMYLSFCRENKDYPNSKADIAIKYILECYDKVIKENDFL